MNFFEYFYCKAYNYYNIKKYKKSNGTLRISAISLLSMFQAFNILTLIFTFSMIIKKNVFNKWYGLFLAILIIGYNLYHINIAKSSILIKKYELMPEDIKSTMKLRYRAYIIGSILLFLIICVVYK